MEKYYKAYDERYKTIHTTLNKEWAGSTPSYILKDLLTLIGATTTSSILEIGCGEGQNAMYLLSEGFNVLASDVSSSAISWCKSKTDRKDNFFVLDILDNEHTTCYDFIYSISTLHMLVPDSDREQFFKFIYSHLNSGGKAIVTVMGDGEFEKTDCDITKAFELSERTTEEGEKVMVASTTCKIVSWGTLFKEIAASNLKVTHHFITEEISGFNKSMVVIVQK